MAVTAGVIGTGPSLQFVWKGCSKTSQHESPARRAVAAVSMERSHREELHPLRRPAAAIGEQGWAGAVIDRVFAAPRGKTLASRRPVEKYGRQLAASPHSANRFFPAEVANASRGRHHDVFGAKLQRCPRSLSDRRCRCHHDNKRWYSRWSDCKLVQFGLAIAAAGSLQYRTNLEVVCGLEQC